MSLARNCDIANCKRQGKNYILEYLNSEIISTGNSDYGVVIEKVVKNDKFDLCEKHAKEYDYRIAKVLVKDEQGLRFPNE